MSTQGYYETSPFGHDVPLRTIAMIARRDGEAAVAPRGVCEYTKVTNVRKYRGNARFEHGAAADVASRRTISTAAATAAAKRDHVARRIPTRAESTVAVTRLARNYPQEFPSHRVPVSHLSQERIITCARKRSTLSRRPRLSISRDECERPPTHGDATRRAVGRSVRDSRCTGRRDYPERLSRHWISPIGSKVASSSSVGRPRAAVAALAFPSSWTSSSPSSTFSSCGSPRSVWQQREESRGRDARLTTGGSMKRRGLARSGLARLLSRATSVNVRVVRDAPTETAAATAVTTTAATAVSTTATSVPLSPMPPLIAPATTFHSNDVVRRRRRRCCCWLPWNPPSTPHAWWRRRRRNGSNLSGEKEKERERAANTPLDSLIRARLTYLALVASLPLFSSPREFAKRSKSATRDPTNERLSSLVKLGNNAFRKLRCGKCRLFLLDSQVCNLRTICVFIYLTKESLKSLSSRNFTPFLAETLLSHLFAIDAMCNYRMLLCCMIIFYTKRLNKRTWKVDYKHLN